MRPHLLRFGGIGAYPGSVEINFDDLSAMGLYLITGPTGAGKTTIFDAMTFALFGKTAGGRESMFVCDLDTRVSPFVEFSFSHQGRRFVAHREPAPTKEKSPTPSKQWLREMSESGAELRTVTGAKNTTQDVVDLLGLDAEQFMQVVLLPQGKFQQFLMANSTDRKPLLTRIFGTGLYARIAFKMKEQADALEAEISDTKNKLENERSNARSAVEAVGNHIDTSTMPSPDDNLDELIRSLTKVFGEKASVAETSAKLFEQAIAAATKGEADAKRFDAAEELKGIQKTHDANAKVTAISKDSLSTHAKALRVKQLIQKSDSFANEHKDALERVATTRSTINKSIQKLKLTGPQADTFSNAVTSASPSALRGELEKLVGVVNQELTVFDDLEDAESDAKAARKSEAEFSQHIAKDELRLAAKEKELDTARKKATAASAAARKLPKLQGAADKLDDLLEQADVESATEALEESTRALKSATDAFEKSEKAYATALENYTKQLSGELAAKLKSGVACPVCGSTTHPKKATKVQRVDTDRLGKDRDNKQRRKVECETDVKAAQKALSAAKEAKKKLPPAAEIKKLKKELESCETLAAEEDELNELVTDLTNEVDEIKQSIHFSTTSRGVVQGQLKSAQKKIAALTPKVGAIGQKKDVAAAALILADVRDAVVDLESYTNKSDRAHAALAESQRAVKESLKIEGFGSEQKAIEALLNDAEISALELKINESDAREKEIARLTGVIGNEEVPRSRPDTDSLESKRASALEANQKAQATSTSVGQALKQLESAKKKIDSIGPAILAKQNQLASASSIATTFFKGAGTGKDRTLGLEEWVQRALFEEVCEVATDQLRTLSGNRYVLTLNAEDAKAKKRAGGLELYVIDGHSGKTRSVNTLSGGEQFLTSLALALALAEVVQRHAGGMELSSLFIDEGFGSLDADTLDVAMDVLLKLHDTGRTVGVITHVEAMQQQLPVGIRINKTVTGSTVDVLAS